MSTAPARYRSQSTVPTRASAATRPLAGWREPSTSDLPRRYTPTTSGDVPDDPEARLVILGPEHAHAARTEDSKARQAAAALLDERGSGPRHHKNALVFLAPDRARLAELEQAIRQYLAWKSIEDE